MASDAKILLTGATGFIGGSILNCATPVVCVFASIRPYNLPATNLSFGILCSRSNFSRAIHFSICYIIHSARSFPKSHIGWRQKMWNAKRD